MNSDRGRNNNNADTDRHSSVVNKSGNKRHNSDKVHTSPPHEKSDEKAKPDSRKGVGRGRGGDRGEERRRDRRRHSSGSGKSGSIAESERALVDKERQNADKFKNLPPRLQAKYLEKHKSNRKELQRHSSADHGNGGKRGSGNQTRETEVPQNLLQDRVPEEDSAYRGHHYSGSSDTIVHPVPTSRHRGSMPESITGGYRPGENKHKNDGKVGRGMIHLPPESLMRATPSLQNEWGHGSLPPPPQKEEDFPPLTHDGTRSYVSDSRVPPPHRQLYDPANPNKTLVFTNSSLKFEDTSEQSEVYSQQPPYPYGQYGYMPQPHNYGAPRGDMYYTQSHLPAPPQAYCNVSHGDGYNWDPYYYQR